VRITISSITAIAWGNKSVKNIHWFFWIIKITYLTGQKQNSIRAQATVQSPAEERLPTTRLKRFIIGLHNMNIWESHELTGYGPTCLMTNACSSPDRLISISLFLFWMDRLEMMCSLWCGQLLVLLACIFGVLCFYECWRAVGVDTPAHYISSSFNSGAEASLAMGVLTNGHPAMSSVQSFSASWRIGKF